MPKKATPGRSINPFEYTRPITDSTKIISRRSAVNRVIIHVRRKECVSVVAPRQTGKTTFLRELKVALQRDMPDARTVYVDFEGFNGGNLEALGRHLTDAALKETTNWDLSDLKSDPTKMVALMRQWAKSDPCVFLIDELPYSKYLAYQFLSAVRNYYITCLLSEPNEIHQFVITGSLDLGHLSRDVNPEVSPFNIAVEEYLEDFSQEDIVKFIRQNAQGRFSENTIRAVAEYTHGHPFLTQYLCYQIWSRSPEEQAEGLSSEDATLKTSDLEDTINVRSMADALWRDAGTFEREIELLKNIALRRNIPFVASHRAIRNLQLQGWIVERDGNCAIRNPLYRRILEKILAINAQLTPIRTPTYDDCFQKLKNFDGWVAISIWGEGAPAPYEPTSDRFTLRLGMKYELRVTVAKGGRQPEDYQGKVKQLIIRGGDDLADAVRIGVRPESFYPFGLEGEEEAVFPRNPGESMRTLKFRLLSRPGYAHENGRVQGITEGNDETVKDVQLFINIYQDVSLVDVLRLWVRVC